MEVIFGNISSSHLLGQYACALGFFDGIHIGHQRLISTLKDVSKQYNLKSMVFTFKKHPMTLLDKNNAPKLITDNETKTKIFEEMGIDILVYCDVSRDFLSTNAENFLRDTLVNELNIKAIIAGFNFKFGYKGAGNSDYLLDFSKRTGTNVKIVEPVYIDGQLVSSTAIRNFLKLGNIKMTNRFLGKHYSIHGEVVHGKERGRNLGFPTANIAVNRDLIVPKNGVYITKVYTGGRNTGNIGVTNVGHNPTFGSNPVSIETHIIDFSGDLYGMEITIEFYEHIRDEIPFKNPSGLIKQVNMDKMRAIKYFE